MSSLENICDIRISDLTDEKFRSEYVPRFLNTLRERCSWLIGTTSSGQDENKNISKTQESARSKHPVEFRQRSPNTVKSSKSNRKKYVPFTTVERIKPLPPDISNVQEFPPIDVEFPVKHHKKYSLLHNRFTVKKTESQSEQRNDCHKSTFFRGDKVNKNSLNHLQTEDFNYTYEKCSNVSDSDKCESDEKQNDSDLEVILPSFQLITSKECVDNLICIYCKCVETNSIPNLSMELYFLFQLFTAKATHKMITDVDTGAPLNTIHNCVYFSTSVLNRQRDLLSVLDRSTLRLMCQIPRLSEFSKDLHEYILELSADKPPVSIHRTSSIQGVSFQADTDNRNNFPNDQTFNTFKKQRDMFYELFREWKEGHFAPDWIKKSNFVARVRNISSTAVNASHLARLIHSQLTAICDNEAENDRNEEEIASLKRSFPEKFEKLQQRFKTPVRVTGPNSPPSFHGSQEFFKDFLDAANSVSLNQHLIDNFIAKIIELNQIELDVDARMGIDEMLKARYFNSLCLLRMLAKFLGYLVFLPYQNCDFIPADIITIQCSLRNTCIPPLDICGLLLDAMKNNRLILTVPWVVEYISMMDPVAPHLEYYQRVFELIFHIYKSLNHTMYSKNRHFLKFVLGWLFEMPNFPTSSFFLCIDKLQSATVVVEGLDMLDIVDQQTIYLCCPFLRELRILLEEYLIGIKKKGQQIRKINPVSADNVSSSCITAEQLEYKLEDNFFHLQSSSVKKTVEFVAERIAAKAIHQIRNEIIPLTKQKTLPKLKEDIEKIIKHEHLSEIIIIKISDISENLYIEMQKKAIKFAKLYCKYEIEKVMPLLLQNEMCQEVLRICNSISYRMAINKVVQWTKTYVTFNYVSNDLKAEIEKMFKKNIVRKKSSNFNPMVAPSDLIIDLRKIIKEILQKKSCCFEDVAKQLLQVKQVFVNKEIAQNVSRMIGSMTVELWLFLIIYEPILSEKFFCDFSYLWCNIFTDNLDVSTLLCPRNLKFLLLSQNIECTWSKFTKLYQNLLQNKRILVDDLQKNCKLIFRQKWPKSIKNKIILFIRDCSCDSESLFLNNKENIYV
ncbi:codanin-1-like [Centruroides sculpturatus]|uniref:codanin-1-like n=1 Tax=Centruroides sculpturatus TaxID=218467 RepID=UPI000C6D2FCF|nr:codanin-1-like [Centruroides sculpturatus]